MKLFKQIDIANTSDIHNYIGNEKILRLANTIVIDVDDRLLFAKYDNKKFKDIHSKEFYNALCEMDFITIPSYKRLTPNEILSLYDKNIRVLVEPKISHGVRVFRDRILNHE